MAESYREIEQRHAALDAQMERQEYDARWAGHNEYIEVAAPDPARVRDCTNCRYADGGVCREGMTSCSGWLWDPRDEVAA